MFDLGTITAFPTDTSFGLGVRADDSASLIQLKQIKKRPEEKYFSLMVRDWEMLSQFAKVPTNIPRNFFTEKPRTVILRPDDRLPKSQFWPTEKVAFRIATIPVVAEKIEYPITATSANFSGEPPIFSAEKIRENFGDQVVVFPGFEVLPEVSPSEIWDYTAAVPVRLR